MNQVSFNKVRLSLAVLLCLCATSMVNAKYGRCRRKRTGKVPEERHPYRCKRWETKSYLHSHSR